LSGRSAQPPFVLFVAGLNRSGTTLLDAILGEPEPLVSVGELHYLWRGLVQGWNCGCGEPLRECGFWTAVRERAIGPGGEFEWRELDSIQRAQVRSRPSRLLRLQRRLDSGMPRSAAEIDLARYRDTTEWLYRAIAQITDARVIVDSSKGPHDAAVLAAIKSIPGAVAHLVRDPRAVAHSWTQRVPNPTRPGGYLEQAPPALTAARWLTWNAAIESLVRPAFRPRFRTVRYEDLCSDPAGTINGIYEMIGRPGLASAVDEAGAVELTRGHAIAGDPFLSGRGLTQVRPSAGWSVEMGPAAKAAVTAIAMPMLPRYGYPVLPNEGPGS
jgi:hypothetical protein